MDSKTIMEELVSTMNKDFYMYKFLNQFSDDCRLVSMMQDKSLKNEFFLIINVNSFNKEFHDKFYGDNSGEYIKFFREFIRETYPISHQFKVNYNSYICVMKQNSYWNSIKDIYELIIL